MRAVIVDTGVWIAMCDSRDQVRDKATVQAMAEQLERLRIIVPWPTVYETLRTKLVRNRQALSTFDRWLKRKNIEFLDDRERHQEAFELALDWSLRRERPMSMVDCLIRIVLDDASFKIDYLATFNDRDFVDVCRQRRVELLAG